MLSRARFDDDKELILAEEDVGLSFFKSSQMHANVDLIVQVFAVFSEDDYDGEWLHIGRYLSTLSRLEGWSNQEFKCFQKKAWVLSQRWSLMEASKIEKRSSTKSCVRKRVAAKHH